MKQHEMEDEVAKKLTWLTSLMEALDLKPTPFAKMAGVSPSTITRFLKDPSIRSVPRDNTLDAIAMNLGIPSYTGRTTNEEKTHGFHEKEAKHLEPLDIANNKHINELFTAKVDVNDDKALEKYWIMNGNLLENIGIIDGDILEVDYQATPQINDIVCISLRDEENIEGKTVFRKLVVQHPVPAAIMATNDKNVPSDQLVTFIDGVNARVYGVVSMVFRKYKITKRN